MSRGFTRVAACVRISFFFKAGWCSVICTRSVQKVPSHVIWKIETFIEEDTKYKKHCTEDSDISVPFKVAPWDLTQFSHSPSAAPLYFPESYRWSEICSFSKVILVLGKDRSCRVSNLGCRGLSHLDDLMFFAEKLCTRCDAWAGTLLWWSCQSPVAHSCGLWIFQRVSAEECSSLTQNLMPIRCSTGLVILNATTTQYTCHSMASTAPTD